MHVQYFIVLCRVLADAVHRQQHVAQITDLPCGCCSLEAQGFLDSRDFHFPCDFLSCHWQQTLGHALTDEQAIVNTIPTNGCM